MIDILLLGLFGYGICQYFSLTGLTAYAVYFHLFCYLVYCHLLEIKDWLEEIEKVVKPNGD